MRTELEILNKLCAIEFQIKMYLRHYGKYSLLIKEFNIGWFDGRIFKFERKREEIKRQLFMLAGMKNELLWIFQRP